MDINVENLSDAELNLLVNKIAEARERRKREKKEYYLAKIRELWEDIEKAGFEIYAEDGDDFYNRIYSYNLNIE